MQYLLQNKAFFLLRLQFLNGKEASEMGHKNRFTALHAEKTARYLKRWKRFKPVCQLWKWD